MFKEEQKKARELGKEVRNYIRIKEEWKMAQEEKEKQKGEDGKKSAAKMLRE